MKKIFLILFSISLFTISLIAQQSANAVITDETSFKTYLDAGRTEPIEGIYKSMSGAYFRVGIKKVSENKYVAVVLDLDPKLKKRWKTGDIKAQLERSSVPNLYSIRWVWNDKSEKETVATFENNTILKLDISMESLKYLKIYPVTNVQ